jgi:hypothetical protein
MDFKFQSYYLVVTTFSSVIKPDVYTEWRVVTDVASALRISDKTRSKTGDDSSVIKPDVYTEWRVVTDVASALRTSDKTRSRIEFDIFNFLLSLPKSEVVA